MLEVGTKVPELALNDKHGNPVSPSDFAGKKLMPKAKPGTDTEEILAYLGKQV